MTIPPSQFWQLLYYMVADAYVYLGYKITAIGGGISFISIFENLIIFYCPDFVIITLFFQQLIHRQSFSNFRTMWWPMHISIWASKLQYLVAGYHILFYTKILWWAFAQMVRNFSQLRLGCGFTLSTQIHGFISPDFPSTIVV
jgi:hypothetical protein